MGNTSALSRSVIFRAIERGDLKVVFASGYGEADDNAVPGATHLGKPYEQDELAEALGSPG